MSLQSNMGLYWFFSTLLYDWSKKLASLSRPIRCKITINHDLVARIFLPFGRFACFYSEFSLALQGIFLSSFHNNYFGFVLRHSIEKRSMNGNPYFPRRYKYSSSQRRNSSNLFFLVIYVHLLNLLSHLAWSPSPLPIKKHQINHFLTISFSKLWWSSWEVKFFLCPAPVKQQMKSEKNFVAHMVYTKSTPWWKCVTISGFHGQKTDQSRNKQDHVKQSLPTCWASCD